ncbi:hypothetical protein BB560_003408 [Smittium megazygosporum]|uniref:FAD-binding FR-type domain-containing protein n=1 Tax=Smittium megazygosporum TaxID=133381 RepID=A0A2T9ZC24_9FUNG|nr:hypothetical protein BB560_003408 [Smittium megazygosporum]
MRLYESKTPVQRTEKNGPFNAWLYCKGKIHLWTATWVLLNICLSIYFVLKYKNSPDFTNTRALFGWSFIVARSAAGMIHVCTIFNLLPLCKVILTKLRNTFLGKILPFDSGISFHKLVGIETVFFSLLHTFAHYFNYYKAYKVLNPGKSIFYVLLVSGPSWTGHIMLVCLFLIMIPALDFYRRKNYNTFWYLHQSFFIYFFMFSIHGSFCLIKAPSPPYCRPHSSFWKYYFFSGILYVLELVLREFSSKNQKNTITKVILHPSQVIEIQMQKNAIGSYKPGQYVLINVPIVSVTEWHPFTLTSSPQEDFLSIHVRIVGDWTKKLSKVLGAHNLDLEIPENIPMPLDSHNSHFSRSSFSSKRKSRYLDISNVALPDLHVNGPIGSPAQDFSQFNTVVLIAGGIGVTPFASILKSLWFQFRFTPSVTPKPRKVYFIWSLKDTTASEWFQYLLMAIEEEDHNPPLGRGSFENIPLSEKAIDISIYITKKFQTKEINNLVLHSHNINSDTITNLRSQTFYGRPNFPTIFSNISRNHPDETIGVFFCGPKIMGKTIESSAYEITVDNAFKARFKYHEEFF